MIEDLKPYSETKDSGLPWLGDIPAHWEIKRNGSLFQQRNAVGEPDWPILEVSLRTGVRIREFGSSKRKQVMSDKAKYKCATKGDYVYNMMRMWQGAAGIAPVDGLVSPAYVVAKPLPHTNPAYFASLFRTDDYLAEIDAFSRGIVKDRNRLYWDQFKQIPTPCPPPEEQAAIARFLAWATNRLDRAIGAKRRIIALLQEQKQAIIHRAVTRGLDPSVPLKDSGIPWLGEIPEHWRVTSLRMHYSVVLGKMLDEKRFTGHNPIPYLRNRDVQWDRVLVEELPKMDIAPQELDRYTLKLGDMLVCEGGQVGRSAFWLNHLPVCGYQKALHRVRALNTEENCPRYLFYQMRLAAGLGVFEAESNESTISHLTCEKLRSSRFTFPPLEEQIKISRTLDERLKEEENTVSRLVHEISLLREYRTRLIADVVTGKLDVQEAEAGLPEEELQDQPDSVAGYDADGAEDDAESDLIDTAED